MTRNLYPQPVRRTNTGFANLPVPRLEHLRDRYLELLTSEPMTAYYSSAALAEIEAALVAARTRGAA
jgi:hypothetical protein